MRSALITGFYILCQAAVAQEKLFQRPIYFFPLQFAGSTGLGSAGAGMALAKQKLECSVLFGYLPAVMGGPVHTATMKFGYQPFRKQVNSLVSVIPFQAGIFFAQHFGKNLSTTWDSKYPSGYYWWARNTRQHLFLSTGFSFHPPKGGISAFDFYFEANTNDLYLYSYFSNLKTLSFYEIIYFGAGAKVRLKQKSKQ